MTHSEKLQEAVKYFFILSLCASTNGCGGSKQNDLDGKKSDLAPPISMQSNVVGDSDMDKYTSNKKVSFQQPKTFVVNGEKYKLLSETLQGGSKVLNTVTNEVGTVMGSIYITLNDESVISTLNDRFKVTPFADDVVEIAPLDDNEPLLELYRELNSLAELDNVELKIMYLAPAERPTNDTLY